jgi:hypothetical protein
VCLCLLVFFKFSTIVLTFVLVAVAQYLVLLSMTMLITKVRNPGSEGLNRKLRWVLAPLHIAFLTTLVCGISTTLGAFCTTKRIYPVIFFALPGLIGITLVLFTALYFRGFGLKWTWGADHWKQFGS